MQTSIVESPPWFSSLGEVMEPAPELLDELVTTFAPLVTDVDPDVYWTALHCYALDRLMGVVFDAPVDEAWVREAAWVSYATGFWCARSWRGYNFGLEAISRAAIVALARDDADLALRALAGNIVFDGSWGSLVLGVLDGSAALPEVVTASPATSQAPDAPRRPRDASEVNVSSVNQRGGTV